MILRLISKVFVTVLQNVVENLQYQLLLCNDVNTGGTRYRTITPAFGSNAPGPTVRSMVTNNISTPQQQRRHKRRFNNAFSLIDESWTHRRQQRQKRRIKK
mmetsp:Transcript_3577/g.5242  ORF Transcript_3577/g.5242 Transcript_3577/m.5242 type:complete len:101 (-) Transcript_3577:67-369(-)